MPNAVVQNTDAPDAGDDEPRNTSPQGAHERDLVSATHQASAEIAGAVVWGFERTSHAYEAYARWWLIGLTGSVLPGGATASYRKQLQDYIFRPLGLRRTSLPGDNRKLPDVHGYISLRAYDKNASSAPVDTAALSPAFGWSAAAIRATVEDVADFYRGLFSGKLLPMSQVAAMEVTTQTGGAYGLGLMPTDAHGYEWGPYTKAINTTCGRAWGHGGALPGYYQLPISSPDGSRQAVLLVNADQTLLTRTQLKLIYNVLDIAYCRGVPS